MTDEKVNFDSMAKAQNEALASRTNERSDIAFPYLDLDSAVEVAQKIYARSGISACALDELAAEMGQTTSSGNFRLKTGTARIFGLVVKESQSDVKLSDLGNDIVSPDAAKAMEAKASAFLQVPLYYQIYEKYRGKLLPPTKALEREMLTLGVSSKQTENARRAFQKSAKQAGFFNSGEDRLVKPKASGSSSSPLSYPETIDQAVADRPPQDNSNSRQGGLNGSGGNHHPFIQGLLQTMPEPGTLWTIDGRAAWLQTAANIFTLIYKGEGKIAVEAITKEKSN